MAGHNTTLFNPLQRQLTLSHSVMTGKRQAEAHARYQDDAAGAASKKPRFDYRNPSTLAPDAPEEDAILELDEIGKGGQQTKRNAVNLDGYDTDSSDENFDARAEEKARLANPAAASKDEEELDMFADLDETAGANTDRNGADDDTKKGRKAVRFIDINDIEGQVHSSKSGGHVSADFALTSAMDKGKRKLPSDQDEDVESSSDSASDEEVDRLPDIDDNDDALELGAGSKKKHAPKLDAFNMEREGEEGRFDESGNFIRKAADPDAVHDSWLDGLNKKDMKKAKEAQEKRDQERRAKLAADDAMLSSDLLSTLILHLEKGETALEALQRLQSQAKPKPKVKKVPKWKQKKKTADADDAMDVDQPASRSSEQEDAVETRRKAAVEAITGAADALFSRDQQDIYDKEREVLMRQYTRDTGEDWQPPPDPAPQSNNNSAASAAADAVVADAVSSDQQQQQQMWEYRWADNRDGGQPHGPYDGNTMSAWNSAGYFGNDLVEFRKVKPLQHGGGGGGGGGDYDDASSSSSSFSSSWSKNVDLLV